MPKTSARLVVVAVLLALSGAGLSAQSTFTLPEILSAPFPSDLTAAPTGGAVAWVFDTEGARNIWVAEPPDYRARALTRDAKDDGQEVGGLTWTPDAKTIVYVRGGSPNRQGEIPNPVSDPEGAEQAIFAVSTDGGAPRQLAQGASPAVSPRGDRVAYTVRGQAWWVGLGDAGKPAQIFKARGQIGSLTWSPDGAALAFVSARGDHSLIGVYDVAGRTLRYLDPSVDRDGNPVWSPNGRRVAFRRVPASRRAMAFAPEREAEPWSIRVADVASGAGREVWRARAGRGSVFHAVVADSQIWWAAGDRLVFPWEGDGWTHLYTVPESGGEAQLLTPGAFEVEDVVPSPDGRSLVYNSNQDDADRRHIWKVHVDGGAPEAVTAGAGIEWAPTPTADGRALALLRSDARMPAHPAIKIGNDAPRDLAPDSLPASFPRATLVEPQPVVFPAADGLAIHAQLFLPPAHQPGARHPAVLFFHGGSRRQMLLGWHYSAYYHNAYALNQYLARRGFVVLAVNYRSGIGYGLEFREALNYGATGASEFNDVLGAGLYLRGRPDVDPARIGLWGGSYGGYLTALGLSRASDLFAAGVDMHGVHDWNVVIRNFVASYDPQAQTAVARLAFESSPMASLDGWRSPVLLIHGDDDRNVPFSETVTLVEELRKRHVDVEQRVFPDEVHSFLTYGHWLAAYEAAADFFQRKLGGAPSR